jgi:hypothetical protein
MTSPKETFYVTLPVATMSDAEVNDIVAAIGTNAPNSDLYKQSPPIASTVDAAVALGKAWTAKEGDVAADLAKLLADKKLALDARTALLGKLQLLRGQVQDAAPDAAAARAVGVPTRDGNALPAPLLAPSGATITFSKKVKGQFRSVIQGVPGIQTFKTQISLDAVNPSTWSDVEGHGKTHTFRGYASGTHLWLRFAATRGQRTSDWSLPVLVIVP